MCVRTTLPQSVFQRSKLLTLFYKCLNIMNQRVVNSSLHEYSHLQLAILSLLYLSCLSTTTYHPVADYCKVSMFKQYKEMTHCKYTFTFRCIMKLSFQSLDTITNEGYESYMAKRVKWAFQEYGLFAYCHDTGIWSY